MSGRRRAASSPSTALARVARGIETDVSTAAVFATIFNAHVNAADGQVRFVDAGHGLTIMCRAEGPDERLESR